MALDPREIPSHTRIGTALRDAAVDPHEDDFLPPTNAGATGEIGNPHGPTVVSPEIHASARIRPGDVSDDPATQSQEETEFLYERQPQTNPIQTLDVTGTATVAVEETTALTATADFLHTENVDVTSLATWTSGTPATATVSSSGVVTGVAEGTSVITAEFDGKTDTLTVTVSA